jgi:hypothetical protein
MKTFRVGDVVRTLCDNFKVPGGYVETIIGLEHNCIGGYLYSLQGFPSIFYSAYELELVETSLSYKQDSVDDRLNKQRDANLNSVFG